MALTREEIQSIAVSVAEETVSRLLPSIKCAEAGMAIPVLVQSMRTDLDRIRTDKYLASDYIVSINQHIGALMLCGKKFENELHEQLGNLTIAAIQGKKAETEEYLARVETILVLPVRGESLTKREG